MAARCPTVGAMGPARIPWSTAAVSVGSLDRRVHDAVQRAVAGTGQALEEGRRLPDQRTGEVHGQQHGHEGDGGGRDGPLQHRHLDDQGLHPLGGLGGHQQADVPTEGHPTHHGPVDPQVVQQTPPRVGRRCPSGGTMPAWASRTVRGPEGRAGRPETPRAARSVASRRFMLESMRIPCMNTSTLGPVSVDLVVELDPGGVEHAHLEGCRGAGPSGPPGDGRPCPLAVVPTAPLVSSSGQRYAAGRRCASTGSSRRTCRSRAMSRSATTTPGPGRSVRPPPSPMGRRPWCGRGRPASPAGRSPTCPAPITKTSFSTARARSRSSQWAGPVAAVNAGRHDHHGGPHQGHDPVELREAEVVADRQAEDGRWEPSGSGSVSSGTTTRSVPGPWWPTRRSVGAGQVHVEEVDLAVDGGDGPPVGSEQTAGVEEPVRRRRAPGGRALREAAGHEMDAVTPGQCSTPQRAVGPSSGSAWPRRNVRVPGHREVLGQHHQRRAGRGGFADQHSGVVEVGLGLGAGRGLDGPHAHDTG